jgi:N-dimethylarginine dimethylaminohydrolase
VSAAEPAWGVDSEHGRLLDVLRCKPDNYRWLPTSAISRATLESGTGFDPAASQSQHAEMVAVYEEAGVRCHYLEPDPALTYQVFTRDSSVTGPNGPVITQLNQWWRRGEYAAAIRFYAGRGIAIRGMITAASLEGGDVIIVEPGSVLIGFGESRTLEPAARQLAGWFEEDGWETRLQPIPDRFVHIDVLVSVLAEKLAAVCTEALPSGAVEWLRGKGFEIIEVSAEEAFTLGVNAISLGGDRVLSAAGAGELNEALRARGLTVHDPDLSMFTLGGGGAHCLAQALRRERCEGAR